MPRRRPMENSSLRRMAAAGLCLLAYALPLFWPPAAGTPITAPDAGLVARLYPEVPPWWVIVRLAALAVGAALVARATAGNAPRRSGAPATPAMGPKGWLGWLAAGVGLLHVASAPWVRGLEMAGQATYLLSLFVPGALLVLREAWPGLGRPCRKPAWAAVAALIVSWVGARAVTDLGSPRAADMVDGWRGIVDTAVFLSRGRNLLADRLDPDLPGLGATMLFFHGAPLITAGVMPLAIAPMQVAQWLWLALCAVGVAALVRALAGWGAAIVAVAVFLYSPYTRFTAMLPGPFLLGPLYLTPLALCALAVRQRRSEAGLAWMGALCGLALTLPGVVPIAGVLAVVTLWEVRRTWRTVWTGLVAGLASFGAAVWPAIPGVIAVGQMRQHFQLHGTVGLLEPALLGQASLTAFEQARAAIVWRPADIVLGAVLEPFANPRTALRLWGDAIFDPVGATLIAVAVLSCGRAAVRSPWARFLLVAAGVTLAPAFASPVDRVDITHAVGVPLAGAVLAGIGFAIVRRQLPAGLVARWAAIGVAAAVAVGGSVLFDVVNPRLLSASAPGVMVRAVDPASADRVVMLEHVMEAGVDVRWLFTGPMTAYAGARPVGFLPYDGGALPADGLAADGRDVLFWSPGLEADRRVSAAVCAAWPAAVLYELWDEARRGRVLAARVGGAAWAPRLAAAQVRTFSCAERGA